MGNMETELDYLKQQIANCLSIPKEKVDFRKLRCVTKEIMLGNKILDAEERVKNFNVPFGKNVENECECLCHTQPILHDQACCSICPICKRKIIIKHFESHVENCKIQRQEYLNYMDTLH
jgi:hypothetical protein